MPRFVEIELTNGARRRVNPDQVAYLVANHDDTATTLVFTGFAGGLLELQAKGSEADVVRGLERPSWPWTVGVDLAKPEPEPTERVQIAGVDGSTIYRELPKSEARQLIAARSARPLAATEGLDLVRKPGGVLEPPPKNRAQRRAQAKKGKA